MQTWQIVAVGLCIGMSALSALIIYCALVVGGRADELYDVYMEGTDDDGRQDSDH